MRRQRTADRLPTIVPPDKKLHFHMQRATATLSQQTLFDEDQVRSSVTWKPRPANGNRMILANFQGYDAVAKVLGGLQPSQLNILFRTEVEALKRLRNCENAVKLIAADIHAEFSENGARAPVIMTLRASLGSVSLITPSAGGLPIAVARTFFDKLLAAIEYAHLLRIAHTDVCLENMLIDHTGNIVVTGWGRSKFGASGARLEKSHVLNRERGRRSNTSTIGRYAWPPELRKVTDTLAPNKNGTNNGSNSEDSSDDEESSLSEDEHQMDDMDKDEDGYWDDIPLASTQYDAYAGDVWAAGVCLLVMCTGRSPFPSLSLSSRKGKSSQGEEAKDTLDKERSDWALNAWNEGESGRRRFWEMQGTLQPSIIKEIPRGLEELLNGVLSLNPRKRFAAQRARAHRWTRTGGNHVKNHVIASYIRHSLKPTLHGVSGDRDLAEKQLSKKDREIAAIKASANARAILGGSSAEFDLESDDEDDGKIKRKKEDPDQRGAARLLQKLGNKGLSFYQANVYMLRNMRRTRIEQIQQMNKRTNRISESSDKSVLRSSLQQLGVQRAKLLAQGEKNDAIYPHLEAMWSRSIGKQIMVRLPPPNMSKYGKDADENTALFEDDERAIEDYTDEDVETGDTMEDYQHDSVASKIKNMRRKKRLSMMREKSKAVDLKALEKDIMSRTKDLVNLYLTDDKTVADIKRLAAEKAFELDPGRFFDHETHVLCLCGKALEDNLKVKDSTSFNRGNTVFRLFHRDHIPSNERHSANRQRIREGRGYVRLFEALSRSSDHKDKEVLRKNGYDVGGTDDDINDLAEKAFDKLRTSRDVVMRAVMLNRLPPLPPPREIVVLPSDTPEDIVALKAKRNREANEAKQEAQSALKMLACRSTPYKLRKELSAPFISDPWGETVTGTEFVRMGLRLREEVLAKKIHSSLQASSELIETKDDNNLDKKEDDLAPEKTSEVIRNKKRSTRITKGTVITGIYENVHLRRMLKQYPEAESLRRATRNELTEALSSGVLKQVRFLGERDILTLVRTFRTRREKREEQRLKRQQEADEKELQQLLEEREKTSTEIHYLSWKNALETQNFAWKFTGQYSKAAADKRRAREIAFKRREKRRLELYERMQQKKDAALLRKERKQSIINDLKDRYGILTDYFEEFGLSEKHMDYQRFMQHLVTTFREYKKDPRTNKLGKHWGEAGLTGDYVINYNVQQYRNLQGVKSCETHFRKVDVGGISGQISLSQFKAALKAMDWVYNPRSAEEAFMQFVVEEVF